MFGLSRSAFKMHGFSKLRAFVNESIFPFRTKHQQFFSEPNANSSSSKHKALFKTELNCRIQGNSFARGKNRFYEIKLDT